MIKPKRKYKVSSSFNILIIVDWQKTYEKN